MEQDSLNAYFGKTIGYRRCRKIVDSNEKLDMLYPYSFDIRHLKKGDLLKPIYGLAMILPIGLIVAEGYGEALFRKHVLRR